MKEHCEICNQTYFPEPGFYYGAMFISFIFTGWFSIGFVLLIHWGLGWSTSASFATLIALLAFFFVYIFRLARAIWLTLTVKYDSQAGNKEIP